MTDNKFVMNWLEEMKALLNPDKVVWIDGSEEQLEALRQQDYNDLSRVEPETLKGKDWLLK